MADIISWLLSSGWTRLFLIGGVLIVVGLFPLPFAIGKSLLMLGAALVTLAIVVQVILRLPGGAGMVGAFETVLKALANVLRGVFGEVLH